MTALLIHTKPLKDVSEPRKHYREGGENIQVGERERERGRERGREGGREGGRESRTVYISKREGSLLCLPGAEDLTALRQRHSHSRDDRSSAECWI